MMLKNAASTVITAIALLLSGTVYAQQQQQQPATIATPQVPPTQIEPNGPALWKIADEDTTIYLFGTVHVLPKDMEWYNGPIADAFAASNELVTEIHVKPGGETAVQEAFMKKGLLPENENLRAMISEKQQVIYVAALAKMGLPPAALDNFKPWFAGIYLSTLPLIQADYAPESGVEAVLESKATNQKRSSLETIAFQAEVFDGLPVDSQIAFLMTAADEIETIVPTLDIMVAQWLVGDAEGLAEVINSSFTDPILAERLLYSRNANWAEWIDNRMDKPGTLFIAVGAGHLAGEKSVQEMLEARNIRVLRVQ